MAQKQKIVILGGGVGSIVTAWKLTSEPGWQDRYEISLYQVGWRIGGKGACGRNAAKAIALRSTARTSGSDATPPRFKLCGRLTITAARTGWRRTVPSKPVFPTPTTPTPHAPCGPAIIPPARST